jgi:hypothetical protein
LCAPHLGWEVFAYREWNMKTISGLLLAVVIAIGASVLIGGDFASIGGDSEDLLSQRQCPREGCE